MIDQCNLNEQLILLSGFNAMSGNVPIPKVVCTFDDSSTCNDNGKLLIDFLSFNKLKLINTFKKKTSINTSGLQKHSTLLDYIYLYRYIIYINRLYRLPFRLYIISCKDNT